MHDRVVPSLGKRTNDFLASRICNTDKINLSNEILTYPPEDRLWFPVVRCFSCTPMGRSLSRRL